MALAAAISLMISGLKFGLPIFTAPSYYVAALLAATVYALGFCVRDRITALTGGLLMAVSITFVQQAPVDTTFTLMALLALTACVSQKPLIGLVIAGLAIAAHIDAIVLGLVLLAVLLSDKTPHAGILICVFAASALAGALGLFAVSHHLPLMPRLCLNIAAPIFFFTGGAAIIGWLTLPFLADLAEPARLTRWKPVFAWTCMVTVLSCIAPATYAKPFLNVEPFMIVLAAAGFARILPVIASDAVKPRVRYILAVVAALALAIPKAHLDWTAIPHATVILEAAGNATSTETEPAYPTGKPEIPAAAKPIAHKAAPATAIPKHTVAVSATDLKKAATPPTPAGSAPAAIVAQAVKLGVPITHKDWRGRVLPRNVWAIQWDIKNKLAAKGAAPKP